MALGIGIRALDLNVRLLLLLSFSLNVIASVTVKYMDTRCDQTLDMERENLSGFKFQLTRFSKYSRGMNCAVTIQTRPGLRLMVQVLKIDIDTEFFRCDDFLTVYDIVNGQAKEFPGLSRICGETRPRNVVTSTGNSVKVQFTSDYHDEDDGFQLLITAFHTAPCNNSEFRCNNGYCIGQNLHCNGYNNCGDNSDSCGLNGTNFIAGIVIAIIVISILAAVVVFFVCRRRRRHHGEVLRAPQPQGVVYHPPQQPVYPPPTGYPSQPYTQPPPYQNLPPGSYPPQLSNQPPPPYQAPTPYGYGNPEKPPF